ncbi:MAG: dipicolinate synthase subunit B [Clostridia bacterium]|nr:dipicolinate synthase subunit B [Clostridia bacterium]
MNKTVGFALTGSFCTFRRALETLTDLCERGYRIIPIMSFNAYELDTRFGSGAFFRSELRRITGNEIIHTIPQAEPIGPKKLLDALVICPCTGNTAAKLAAGVADTPVTLAAKSHLRNQRPVVIAVSTNDALAAAAANIGALKNRKNVFFVPFRQDDPQEKPNSVVADFSRTAETLAAALEGRQVQPVML